MEEANNAKLKRLVVEVAFKSRRWMQGLRRFDFQGVIIMFTAIICYAVCVCETGVNLSRVGPYNVQGPRCSSWVWKSINVPHAQTSDSCIARTFYARSTSACVAISSHELCTPTRIAERPYTPTDRPTDWQVVPYACTTCRRGWSRHVRARTCRMSTTSGPPTWSIETIVVHSCTRKDLDDGWDYAHDRRTDRLTETDYRPHGLTQVVYNGASAKNVFWFWNEKNADEASAWQVNSWLTVAVYFEIRPTFRQIMHSDISEYIGLDDYNSDSYTTTNRTVHGN